MEKNRFWVITLIVFSIINSARPERSPWLTIAIIANSALILFNIIVEFVRMRREKNG